ncbi:hypothetical protein D3C80_1639530 [compost metagenome]
MDRHHLSTPDDPRHIGRGVEETYIFRHRSRKQHIILHHRSNHAAQTIQAQFRKLNTCDAKLSGTRRQDTKHHFDQRALPASGGSYNCD